MNREKSQQQSGMFRRMATAWLRFSGPDIRRFNASLEDQERLRRSRVLSVLCFLNIFVALLMIPTAFPVPIYWISIVLFIFFEMLAFFFNRSAHVNLSGLMFVLGINITLLVLMLILPKGIRNSNIPDFDFFLLSVLISGIALPRYFIPFIAIVNIALIILIFALVPHDPLLTEEIRVNQGGFAYSELSDALILQLVGAAIAWLNSWSVDRSLARASRAEELSEAQQRLGEQTHQLAEQNARLEYGLDVLKDAHARFANGDYRARAHLQDNELASLAFSFNLMAERLNRVATVAQGYEHLQQALQQLFTYQATIVHGGPFLHPFTLTGTMVDNLYPWLKQYHQLQQMHIQSGIMIEKIRIGLMRQRTLLAQLTLALNQVHTSTRLLSNDEQASRLSALDLAKKAQRVCEQVEAECKRCLQEVKQLDQLLKE